MQGVGLLRCGARQRNCFLLDPQPCHCLRATAAVQERDTLQQAEDLLKQMGFKGSLFAGAPPPPPLEGDDEEEQQA